MWLPVALLVLVAGTQIALTHWAGLTAWKGGGFGMFAAVDGGSVRTVRVVVHRDDGPETLAIPPSLVVHSERAAAFPAAFMLHRVGAGVIHRERRYGRSVHRVTLEVWGIALSHDGSQADARRLAAHVVEAADVPAR